jgi:hypothetical protein
LDHLTGDAARMAFAARHYILQWSKGVQRFTQCTDLDGKVTQLSGGPIQIGGKPILLIGSRARHAPTKKSARNTVSRRVAERLKSPEMES